MGDARAWDVPSSLRAKARLPVIAIKVQKRLKSARIAWWREEAYIYPIPLEGSMREMQESGEGGAVAVGWDVGEEPRLACCSGHTQDTGDRRVEK